MSIVEQQWIKNTIRKLKRQLDSEDLSKELCPSQTAVTFVRDELLDVSISEVAALVATLVITEVPLDFEDGGGTIEALGIKRSLKRIEKQLAGIDSTVNSTYNKEVSDEEDQEDIPF